VLDGGTNNNSNPETFTVVDSIPLAPPSKPGYEFNGWQSDGVIFSNVGGASTDITLTALWTLINFSITYNTDGGTNNSENPGAFNVKSSITLLPPVKTGFTFAGWYRDSNLTQLYNGTSNLPSANITLFAKWRVNQYSIIFNTNGGDSLNTITQDFGSSLTLPTPIRTGYSFEGWFTDSGLMQTYNVPLTMPAQNIELYAKWTINSYNFSYQSNISPEFKTISAGGFHNIGLSKSGQVYAWGRNEMGELGDGTTQDRTKPTLISFQGLQTGEMIELVTAGYRHSFAVTSKGRVYAWGWNVNGELGDGTTIKKTIPTLIDFTGLENEETIQSFAAVGVYTIALTTNGRVFAWGGNDFGRLGDGTTIDRTIPTLISFNGLNSGETIKSIHGGLFHSFAVTSTGRVYAWGSNVAGQLGDGTTTQRNSPTLITFVGLQVGETIKELSGGTYHSLALTTNGRIFSWGTNSSGQLGDGTNSHQHVPTLINISGLQNGETVQQVIAGHYSSRALTTNGRLFVWGNRSNTDGENDINIPRLISFPGLLNGENIESVNAGAEHSLIVTNVGRANAWGSNSFGQLGDGTITIRRIPGDFRKFYQISILVENYLTITFNDSINLPDPVLEGYTFEGWYMDEELTVPFNLTNMPGNDLLLYAKFTPIASQG
jgi:uncharacterized repeat protein (TIGR02543 family)